MPFCDIIDSGYHLLSAGIKIPTAVRQLTCRHIPIKSIKRLETSFGKTDRMQELAKHIHHTVAYILVCLADFFAGLANPTWCHSLHARLQLLPRHEDPQSPFFKNVAILWNRHNHLFKNPKTFLGIATLATMTLGLLYLFGNSQALPPTRTTQPLPQKREIKLLPSGSENFPTAIPEKIFGNTTISETMSETQVLKIEPEKIYPIKLKNWQNENQRDENYL